MKKTLSLFFAVLISVFAISVPINVNAEELFDIQPGVLNPDYMYDSVASQMREAMLEFDNYSYSDSKGYYITLNVSECSIYVSGVAGFVHAFRDRYTELFFIKNTFSYNYSVSTQKVTKVILYLTDTVDNIKAQMKELMTEVDSILSEAARIDGDVGKVVYLHEYLALNTVYNAEVLNGNSSAAPDSVYTIYGALCEGDAVCQGYSFAYKYLLSRLGIISDIVTSYTMNHAWNLVQLNGKWYHVDITWDDPAWDRVGRVYHNSFLCSNEAITEQNHTSWEDFATSNQTTTSYQVGDEYDSRAWKEISSPFLYHDGLWYYVASNGSFTSYIRCTADIDTDAFTYNSIKTVTDYWYANDSGSCYVVTVGIGIYGNTLYYNTSSKIYAMTLSGENATAIFTYTKPTVYTNVYGIRIKDGTLYYSILSTLSSSGKTANDKQYEITDLFYNRYVYDGVVYTLDQETNTAYAGNGSFSDNNALYAKDRTAVTVHETVTSNGVSYTVNEIGVNAFNKSSCTEISLPQTVQTIGSGAFADCTELEKLVVSGDMPQASSDIFDYSTSLVVYYNGEKSGWDGVKSSFEWLRVLAIDYSVEPEIMLSDDTFVYENGMIMEVELYTKRDEFLSHFDGEYELCSPTGEELTDEYVGTGCLLRRLEYGLYSSDVEIVVKGDADGDGVTSAKDVLEIKKYISGEKAIDTNSAEFFACDIDGDDDIDTLDMQSLVLSVIG